MRIGVVGGGVAGLATAWLLAPNHEVVLSEAEAELGGHAANVSVRFGGEPVAVTPGATHLLGAGAYPLTHRMLSALGVGVEPLSGDLSVVGEDGELRWTSVPSLWRASGLAWTMCAETVAGWSALLARGWRLEQSGDWGVSWRELRASLRVPGTFLDRVAEPVLAGFWGVRPSSMGELSARALLAYLVRPLPGRGRWRPGRPALVRGGTGRFVDALVGDLSAVAEIRRGLPAEAVTREHDGLWLRHALGSERIDVLVVATPPWQAARLVGGPDPDALASLPATPTEIVIHADEPPWSVLGAGGSTVVVTGADRAQLSTVAGSAGGRLLRRSWATYGGPTPSKVLWQGRFRHVAPSSALFALQPLIASWQGTGGCWIAGSWTRGVDSLESALESALVAASGIDPAAMRVRWLTGSKTSSVMRRATRACSR
jgi:predicted NAD/FAD-binding protein